MPSTTIKCDGCGLESEQEEIFRPVPRSFNRKSRTLCPVCFAEKDHKIHIFFFWSFVVVVFLALLLAVFLPSVSLGPWLLNIALFQLFVFLGTLFHELGHVAAGRLVGFRVFGIEIGHGSVFLEFLFGGLRWQFRTVPFGGCAHGAPRNTKNFKLKNSLFILGGPFANIGLIAVSIWALPLDSYVRSGPFEGCVPVLVFLFANAMMVVYSLWPYRYRAKVKNDGWLLWETWRWPKAEVEQLPAHWFLREAQESQRQGKNEAARKWIEDGLRLYPCNYWLEWQQAINLLELKRYGEARRPYAILLGRYRKSEELRFTIFNNIAYVNILSGDTRLLHQADECSRRAFEKHPWNFHFKGTRGSVLIEMGRYEEGLKLLHQALKQHSERRGQALNACYIAIAEARRGNAQKSRNFFALARRLDPKCFLLERESQEHCTNLAS